MSVRTPERFELKNTLQVADVRIPLVLASHIIQAGGGFDLFVQVPSGAAAPIKYKPREVDAINQVADGREQRKRVTFDCSNSIF